MLDPLLGRSVGRDLFFEFVPGMVRPLSDPLAVPLISGAVLAEFSSALGGPVLEASWAGPVMTRGVLRAARHADAVLAISLPAPAPSDTAAPRPADVARLAAEVGFDRPLIIVARAPRMTSIDDGGVERLGEDALAQAQEGFTAISFRPQDIQVDRAERMAQVAHGLIEMGIGVEIEIDDKADAGLLLAELDDEEVPLSAVRGCHCDEELAGGFVVVDPLRDEIPESSPCRVVIDGFVLKALLRGLSEAEAAPVVERAANGVGEALVWAGGFVAELDPALKERIEALTYVNVQAACRMLGAEGVAGELLDAMTTHLYG